MPGFRDMLKHGAYASGHGLLTQAPPNTGAGWFTLATGAWPAVHGSTNNTFHINGAAVRRTRTSAFSSASVLQAETLAQSAERGGKKVAQIEWAGGRSGAINGPTVDYRSFRSGRGVATNYIAPEDNEAFTRSFGLQFDHPTGFAGNAPFPQAAPDATRRAGRTCRARTRRPRRCACASSTPARDKYGLNAYLYDSKNDRKTRYDRVLFSRTKSGTDKVARPRRGRVGRRQGQDRRRRRPLNGKTGRVPDQGRAARLATSRTCACSTRPSRARSRPGRAGASAASRARSRTTSPRSSRPRRRATSPCSRPASCPRTPTSSRATTGPSSTTR